MIATQQFGRLPNILDTIVTNISGEILPGFFSKEVEKELLRSTNVRYVINKKENILRKIFICKFGSYSDKVNRLDKAFDIGNKNPNKQMENNKLPFLCEFLGDFILNDSIGQIEFLPFRIPYELFMIGMLSREEILELNEEERIIKYGSLMYKFTTRVILPNNVTYVEGAEFVKITDREIIINLILGDLLFDNAKKLSKFKIVFDVVNSIMHPHLTEVWEPEPAPIQFDEKDVPSDAIVLFDGKSVNEWMHRDSSNVKWDIKKRHDHHAKNWGDNDKKRFWRLSVTHRMAIT